MLAVKKWPAVCHHCEICKNYLCGLVKITYQSKIPSKIGKIRFFSKFVFRTIKPLFIHPFEKSYFNDMFFGTSSKLVIPITWYVLKKRVLNSKYLDTVANQAGTNRYFIWPLKFIRCQLKVQFTYLNTVKGRHGRFLAGNAATVAATLPARLRCCSHFLILKI